MRLFHISDIHLGRRRCEGRLPDADLAQALGYVAKEAIANEADVFLIAGDLFNSPQIQPEHLRQAEQCLIPLKEAGIPVVAIDGNHDRKFFQDAPSWLHYLNERELLHHLEPQFSKDGANLPEWDPEKRAGAWIELGGVRFLGLGYLGAGTPRRLEAVLEAWEPFENTVMLLHAGPDYFVGESGGFSVSKDLPELKGASRYLALGHIHKPMLFENWACNPGSPENCELRENDYSFEGQGRGFAVVDLDVDQPITPVSIQIKNVPRRPCFRLEIDCSDFSRKTKDAFGKLKAHIIDRLRSEEPAVGSVLDLRLVGNLKFGKMGFDASVIASELENEFNLQAAVVDATQLNVDSANTDAEQVRSETSRAELESLAVGALLQATNPDLDEGELLERVGLFLRLKEAVRSQEDPETIAERILMERCLDATENPRPQDAAAVEAEEEGI